jgi:hypothetical protein
VAFSKTDAARRVAQRAQEHKLLFLGVKLSLLSMLDPRLPILRWALERAGLPPDGDMAVALRDADEVDAPSYSIREILTKVTALRGDVVAQDMLSLAMLTGATRLGDMINRAGLSSPQEPLLEFARHFRKAAAHGDRWEFLGDEPKHPAACRDLVLTKDLHGLRATWTTITQRRYVEFLDDITNHFSPGS